ncbi:hypothetical protein WME99_15570 [Sorangium sp. So ce136]|uniref:hypothetical protein n=1 Tax=Sorangium sp. So ce136 TaxID=3133284 RepID=UPI003F03EEFF
MDLLGFFSSVPPLARRVGAQPSHSIDGFPDGAVGRIVGKVGHLGEERLSAPLTGRACAAWFVRVSGAELAGRGHPPLEARGVAPFAVIDATGLAIVDTASISLLLEPDVTETLGFSRRPPLSLLHFLRSRGKEGRRVAIDWRLSWQEGILAEGQRVAVLGRGRREVDPDSPQGGYRNAATRLVMESERDGEELVVSTFARSLRSQRGLALS